MSAPNVIPIGSARPKVKPRKRKVSDILRMLRRRVSHMGEHEQWKVVQAIEDAVVTERFSRGDSFDWLKRKLRRDDPDVEGMVRREVNRRGR